MRFTVLFLSLLLLGCPGSLLAQKKETSVFDAQQLFAQDLFTKNGNEFRSADGAPGPQYWQNRADYILHASLDTIQDVLRCSETIHYINHSPDKLSSLWIQLDQNTYRKDARSNFYTTPPPTGHTDGYQFGSVKIASRGKTADADFLVNDTRMQIRLQQPVQPSDSVDILINYYYKVPGRFGGRTDCFPTKNGKIYEIAQWYPRMCVYDDLRGWNTLPFLGSGEFYCEYGDFDYTVTVPRGMIVAGSGELQNEQEVLTPEEISRLALARKSDSTVMIRTAEEINASPAQGMAATDTAGTDTASATSPATSDSLATWHFRMHNTRDVAFGASRAYLWDAAKVDLPGGKAALAMSVYPVESAGNDAWGRATEYLKKSIEFFSKQFYVYPYPVAVNEAGYAGGMEYPGIVFDGINDKGGELYWVTAHEIGHNWFPMIVGSDERRNAFMDEGFNTFIDVYAADSFNNGQYAPKRDDEYAPGKGNPADEIIPWLKDTSAPVIMARADQFPEKYRHPIEYFKPAFGLVLLRDVVLGHDRFDYAFRKYIERWAFKHPAPDDFFRTMNNEAGEDLSWFWKEWFYHNWQLDLAIRSVSYTDGDPKKGADVTIANLDRMAMPFRLEADEQGTGKRIIEVPVETWLQGDTHVIHIDSNKPLKSVTIDPAEQLPDSNRKNNIWKK